MSRFLALAAASLLWAPSAHAQSIEWEVADRFRLWDRARDGAHAVSLEQLLDRVAKADSPAAVEALMLGFLATQSDLHEKAYWRKDLETYDREYIWPTHYQVRVVGSGLAGTCTWSSSHGHLERTDAPCSEPVALTLAAAEQGEGSMATTVTVQSELGGATTEIQVRDRLIASVGDSFASGEGNPDVPMDLSRLPRAFASSDAQSKAAATTDRWTAYRFVRWNDDDWSDRWLGRSAVVGYAGGGQWWDTRCHRSFYSQHMVAALRYAAAHPREATTFVTYACSGAETFAGLLVRQSRPPGYRDGRSLSRLKYPQLEVLVANLCPPAVGESAIHDRARSYRSDDKWVADHGWTCTGGRKPRRIDALLVTDGGNDIGFSPVIQDALLPKLSDQTLVGRAVLKQLRRGTLSPTEANRRIVNVLPGNYRALRGRVAEIVPPGTPVIQSAYPNPLYGSDGKVCGEGASFSLAAMSGFWPDRYVDPYLRWRMLISADEATAAEVSVIQPLNRAVREHVQEGAVLGWRLVDDFQPRFENRGWCAAGPGETLADLPNWDSKSREWKDWSPSSWQPYASRARLFRTPNDVAMTQQPADPRRVLGAASRVFEGSLSKQQESLLSSMSGSFHPTFEAHAIMGWSLGEALIRALEPEPNGDGN